MEVVIWRVWKMENLGRENWKGGGRIGCVWGERERERVCMDGVWEEDKMISKNKRSYNDGTFIDGRNVPKSYGFL
jgi:hypothetical protein